MTVDYNTYGGWAVDLRPRWSMMRHRCGWVDYSLNLGADAVRRVIGHHQCRDGAEADPVWGQPLTVEIDLGPVAYTQLGATAQFVEGLPFGLLDRHPVVKAQAERLAEALASHLDDHEPAAAPTPVAVTRAGLHARRIAGTLQPGEPVYVAAAELFESSGALPHRPGTGTPEHPVGLADLPAGIAWTTDHDDGVAFEMCTQHLIKAVAGDQQHLPLDLTTLGQVLYNDQTVDCAWCAADQRATSDANDTWGIPLVDAGGAAS